MEVQETSSVHLTVQQAAQRAGVSSKTIRRWLSSGRLTARFDGQAYAATVPPASQLKPGVCWSRRQQTSLLAGGV